MEAKLEPLSVKNIIEIKKIKEILIDHPDLLPTFMVVCKIANKEINKVDMSKVSIKFEYEDDSSPSPVLSDHSSDSD